MIETILALGDDALDSEGQIVLEPLPFFSVNEALQFRITNFSIPEFSTGAYSVRYKTQEFEKPNGAVTTPHEFTFSFRVDKYWSVYQDLLIWKQIISNDNTGAIAEDITVGGSSAIRTNFSVMTIDSNGIVTSQGWKFTSAWLKSLGSVSFDQTSEGNPLTVDVNLSFVKCIPGADA